MVRIEEYLNQATHSGASDPSRDDSNTRGVNIELRAVIGEGCLVVVNVNSSDCNRLRDAGGAIISGRLVFVASGGLEECK